LHTLHRLQRCTVRCLLHLSRCVLRAAWSIYSSYKCRLPVVASALSHVAPLRCAGASWHRKRPGGVAHRPRDRHRAARKRRRRRGPPGRPVLTRSQRGLARWGPQRGCNAAQRALGAAVREAHSACRGKQADKQTNKTIQAASRSSVGRCTVPAGLERHREGHDRDETHRAPTQRCKHAGAHPQEHTLAHTNPRARARTLHMNARRPLARSHVRVRADGTESSRHLSHSPRLIRLIRIHLCTVPHERSYPRRELTAAWLHPTGLHAAHPRHARPRRCNTHRCLR
jgi:hypothetical protein